MSDSASPQRPTIVEAYTEYIPPFDVRSVVERMLVSVPQQYLIGLSEIVLTSSSALPRRRRRGVTKSRTRKVRIVEARGLYHPAWNGSQPWIEIFVDNALRGWEKGWWLKLCFIRQGRIGNVLFHEIGHYIHYTVRPEYREKEDVADVWKVKLDRNYRRMQHPLFGIVMRTLKRPLD
ncbi:MAG: hypothetical protein WCA10_12930 [Terracidiphilus sp.]